MSSGKEERLSSPPLTKNSIVSLQLVVLIGLALVRGLIYLSLFPPWVAPDEPAHFEAIRIIGQERQMPSHSYYESTPVNPELSQSFQTFRMWELLERSTPSPTQLSDDYLATVSFIDYPYPGKLVYTDSYPILPHILLALVSNMVSAFDIATELYILRLVSVLLMIPVTIIAWLITKRVFPTRPQFWLAIPAFIVFLPMHTHIFASVNTDVFAILLTSILLFLLISFFDNGASKLKVTLIVSLVFLALFIKRTLVFIPLWVGITAILYLGHRRQWAMKKIAVVGLITATFMAVGLMWVIVNPNILSDSMITLFNINIAERFAFTPFANQSLSLLDIVEIYVKSGLFAFITFWGNFGGATTNIPWSWVWGLMVFCAAIILGAGFYTFRAFREFGYAGHYQRNVFIIFITGIVLSLINAFFPVLVAGPGWGPPARYFFPVIIPVATFFFLGAWQLFPAKYRQIYLLPLWLIGLVTYDTLVIVRVLLPFLYG